jgi:hypothetical protein
MKVIVIAAHAHALGVNNIEIKSQSHIISYFIDYSIKAI